ncbi:MAG: biopolymer transporter ExbD [Verrucomicrobia bacterium]|nr:biopolymer transporter ExbD [Verrucomicrobiota bacterium]
MRFPRQAKIIKGPLETAPIAAVLFLLVIFMFIGSSLVFIPGLEIELPKTGGRDLPGVRGPVEVVAMDRSGRVYFDNHMIQESNLVSRFSEVAERVPGLTLVIQADREAKYESVIRLQKAAYDAGMERVLLAIQSGDRD